MSLRHAVLGLLTAEPSSGYELTQRFARSLANAWHASHSQIYPELARLAEEGLVEVVEEGARNRRTWAVTADGREELRRWLMEVEPNRRQRSEPALRGFLLLLLEPEDRRTLLERELAVAEEQGRTLEGLWELSIGRVEEAKQTAFMPMLDLGIRTNRLLREWMREQLDALES